MTIGEFEQVVAEAVEAVPATLLGYLDTVQVTTAPSPTPGQRRRMRLRRRETLYGLYEGWTVPDRLTRGDSGLPPSVITIFRLPLRRDFPDDARLRQEIRRTVFHELAHHFGIGDDELSRWGAY